jgi:hypothetical protein
VKAKQSGSKGEGARTKEVRLIRKAAKVAGGRVELTENGHLLVFGPLGARIVGSKLNDLRTWRNVVADLRTIGIDLRPRPGRKTGPSEATP